MSEAACQACLFEDCLDKAGAAEAVSIQIALEQSCQALEVPVLWIIKLNIHINNLVNRLSL